MNDIRTIKVCAGIGDNIWLLQKLINSGEQFNFQLPNGIPQRGKQIFDLLPQVAASSEYVPGLSYKTLSAQTIKGNWSDNKATDFYLSCNQWLEEGNRLEDWLPDLKVSYKLPWVINEPPIQPYGANKYIGIYGSAYSTQRAWKQYGAWGVKEWLELIRLCYKRNRNYKFVIIGAEWDNDFGTEITKMLTAERIPFVNTIGSTLAQVASWMRAFHYAFYFPSGLPIFSESLEGGSDCTMFYGSNLTKMIGTWCDPERRASGKFKECLFCEPAAIYEWCVQNNKL